MDWLNQLPEPLGLVDFRRWLLIHVRSPRDDGCRGRSVPPGRPRAVQSGVQPHPVELAVDGLPDPVSGSIDGRVQAAVGVLDDDPGVAQKVDVTVHRLLGISLNWPSAP